MDFNKFPRVVSDLRDNIPSQKPPARAVKGIESPQEAARVTDRLLSPEKRERLLADIETLEDGTNLARIPVGKQEDGTRHAHDFIIAKQGDVATLYFVDPEHQMARNKKPEGKLLPRRGEVRPHVATLMALALSKGEPITSASIVRFRTATIEDPYLLKMSRQLEEAQKLLGTRGLPDFLKDKENEVTFRLEVREDGMEVQSRYATPEQLELFLDGQGDTTDLHGKMWSYAQILDHFQTHLTEGKFKHLDPDVDPADEKL